MSFLVGFTNRRFRTSLSSFLEQEAELEESFLLFNQFKKIVKYLQPEKTSHIGKLIFYLIKLIKKIIKCLLSIDSLIKNVDSYFQLKIRKIKNGDGAKWWPF